MFFGWGMNLIFSCQIRDPTLSLYYDLRCYGATKHVCKQAVVLTTVVWEMIRLRSPLNQTVNNWLLHCVARRKHRLEITSSVCTTKLKVFTKTTFRLLLSGWCFHGKECLSEQDGVINHEEAGSNSSQCLINWCRQRESYTCFMLRGCRQLMTCFSVQSRRNTLTHICCSLLCDKPCIS